MDLPGSRTRKRRRTENDSKFARASPVKVRGILIVTIADLNFAPGCRPRYDDELPQHEVFVCRNLT
jgi:hypothetical protein